MLVKRRTCIVPCYHRVVINISTYALRGLAPFPSVAPNLPSQTCIVAESIGYFENTSACQAGEYAERPFTADKNVLGGVVYVTYVAEGSVRQGDYKWSPSIQLITSRGTRTTIVGQGIL